MKPLANALAAIGLVTVAITPAFAAQSEKMAIVVETTDLNLSTPQGQKTLDQRIEKAARTVCRTAGVTTGSRVLTREARDCLVTARADVRQQVAALTASQQRGG